MNEIYERDYTTYFAESPDPGSLVGLLETEELQIWRRVMAHMPRVIVPKEKADYEYLLRKCDAYAREHGGRLRGVVDYEKYEATIEVTLPFFEFLNDADDLLKDISVRACSTTFTATEDGGVRLYLLIGYFEELCELLDDEAQEAALFHWLEQQLESDSGLI